MSIKMTDYRSLLKIEPFKLAEQGFKWEGQVALIHCKRLATDALGDLNQQFLTVDLSLSMDPYYRIAWLKAQVTGSVQLECQRCLEPLDFDLTCDVHLAILNDERVIEQIPEETDFVVLGENDSSQKGDYFTNPVVDLLSLVEDELLLMIPFSPKHDDCEHQYMPTEEIDEPVEKKDNPFEILASLKKN